MDLLLYLFSKVLKFYSEITCVHLNGLYAKLLNLLSTESMMLFQSSGNGILGIRISLELNN